MSNPVEPTYLGDAVYAEFSNQMIGLALDSHEAPVAVWLEEATYKALKRYAQLVGWEPPDVLPQDLPELYPVAQNLRESILTYTGTLQSWLKVQSLYVDIYQNLIERASLRNASIYWDRQDLCFMFSGTGAHLAQVFRVLRTSGFNLEGDRPEAKKSSWYGRFIKETGARIWIHFTSAVCQMKQVRTELKEVPIYDVVCDEGTSTEDKAELEGAEIPLTTPADPDYKMSRSATDPDDYIPF